MSLYAGFFLAPSAGFGLWLWPFFALWAKLELATVGKEEEEETRRGSPVDGSPTIILLC